MKKKWKWEFVFVSEDALHRLQKNCDKYGEEGWEPVNFTQELRESTVSGELRVRGWVAMLKKRVAL